MRSTSASSTPPNVAITTPATKKAAFRELVDIGPPAPGHPCKGRANSGCPDPGQRVRDILGRMEIPNWPAQDSPEELLAWNKLQSRIPELYRLLMKDPRAPQTVVVVPSLSFDARELQ